jgi:hypothetical protein
MSRTKADPQFDRIRSEVRDTTSGMRALALPPPRYGIERVDALPRAIRGRAEALSGVGLADVRVHYDSPRPSNLGALAFTRGSDIFLGAGQDRHLAHEAWHVVQQRQGRVAQTASVDGHALNDQGSLEHEADTMGARLESGSTAPAVRATTTSPARASTNTSPVVQRVIDGAISNKRLLALANSQATYADTFGRMARHIKDLRHLVRTYKRMNNPTKWELSKIVDVLLEIQGELDWLIPGLSVTNGQSNEDKQSYVALMELQRQMTVLSTQVNDEVAATLNIQRAGPGSRPDAGDQAGINATVQGNLLGLTVNEQQFVTNFVQNQGGSYKERREALSAIWAKRTNLFNNLTPGKGNNYGVDVEYQTTDANKPELWDQKSIIFGPNGFDGRIPHTHQKNTDAGGKGVGLLFDSTYVSRPNYEKAWLGINNAILRGAIASDAVKEVVAPNPALLRSEIYVDMNQNYAGGSVETNIKTAEGWRSGNQVDGLEEIASNQLNGTNLAQVKNGQANSHSRYNNNQAWLPHGVYNEFAATGLANNGAGRFVVSDDGSRIYLTVTHYKGFTVKPNGIAAVSRNPFYRVT